MFSGGLRMFHRITLLTIALLLAAVGMNAQTPIITSIDPDTVGTGVTVDIHIYGSGFATGITSDFGEGILVTGTLRLSAVYARASIIVDAGAPLGFHDVIVTNPGGFADTLIDGLFIVPEGDPPTATLIWPTCGDTTACADWSIIIEVEDESGIDPASIELIVGATTYTVDSPELDLSGDSLIVYTPTGGYPEGEVRIALIGLADTLGNSITAPPIDCIFYVDASPPVFDDILPTIEGITRAFSPVIQASIWDEWTDYDTSSLYWIVQGDTFYWRDAPVRFRNDTLFWHASFAGVTYELYDTVHVCIGASDIVGGDCGPNSTEFCWWFQIVIPPPEEMNLSIESVNPANFPFISAYCKVDDEDDRMIEGLTERNFQVWENFEEQYPLIVNSLGGGGAADIVWVIDTTGSMYRMIDGVRDRLIEFTDSLRVSGIDFGLGLVFFADHVSFPYGYEFIADPIEFQARVADIRTGGGGDWHEVAFDGIVDAVDSMHWRPEARKVMVMITDAPYHSTDYGSPFARYGYEDVYNRIMMNDVIAFCIVDTSWVDASRPYEGVYYGPGSITAESGGAFYDAYTDYDTILAQIVENIAGGYYVRWSTSHPVASCDVRNVRIRAFMDEFSVEGDGEFDYFSPCSPDAIIVEPHPDTISGHSFPISNQPFQKIILNLMEFEWEDSVDVSSIQLVVDGILYRITNPELSFSSPYLTFSPSTAWSDNQMVNVILARVMDTQGNLPWVGPIRWTWGADMSPPVVENTFPDAGEVTHDPYLPVGFHIKDEFSGLNEESVLFSYSNMEMRSAYPPRMRVLDIHSPGVSWDGANFVFEPLHAVPPIFNSLVDTICVAVLRAEDMPDYVDMDLGANAMNTVEWCFPVNTDTLCPNFEFIAPYSVLENEEFDIVMLIYDDEYGVHNSDDPDDPKALLLTWDTDGELDIDIGGSVMMVHVAGDTFRTAETLGPLHEADQFVFRLWACADAHEGTSDIEYSCCWSEDFPIHVIRGPIPEIVYPKHLEVSTNEDQEIVMTIIDSVQGVDPSSIIFNVNGADYTVADARLAFINDTLTFVPSPTEYFTDGMWVACSLKRALDFAGDPATPVYWRFFADLTPPVASSPNPPHEAIVLNLEQDITVRLRDEHREVDVNTIEMILNDVDSFAWGSPGISYDVSGEMFRFNPTAEGISWPNNDSVCVTLIASDIMPDYGDQNVMEPYHWCFFPSATTCNYYPNPFTPDGDGINDLVMFTYPFMAMGTGIIRVFDLRNELVWESPSGADSWDGRTNAGEVATPGLYMFVIENDGEVVCSGTVLLAR